MAKRRASTKYLSLLQDPRWQKVRLETMQRADFACEKCGDKTSTLNVHHKNYKSGRNPWEYELNNFVCLCRSCHEEIHEQKELINNFLPYAFVDVSELLSGMIAIQSNNHLVAKIHPRKFTKPVEILLGAAVSLMHQNVELDSLERFVNLLDDREFLDRFSELLAAQSVGMR